jgi:site-specific DNA recombinase
MKVPTWADLRGMFKKRGKGEWSWRLIMRVLDSETYADHWHYGKRNCFTGKINERDYWLTFNVPPIVPEEIWKRAQMQRKLNTNESKRNIKREYLLRGRVKCGLCKSSVNCYATQPHAGKYYLYYRCNGYMGNIANVACSLPGFRVYIVDELVWNWVKDLLTNPGVLEHGLAEYQEGREQFCAPIRDRLIVLEDLWQGSKSQLDRVLDLYISGQVQRELLLDKKQQLESTLAALEKERDELNLNLESEVLTDNEIRQIVEFAAQIAEGLEPGDESFEDRRRIIELLDVRASFIVEDNQKYVDVWCFLGRNKLSIENPTSQNAAPAKNYRCCSARNRRRQHRTFRRATLRSNNV